MDRKFAKTAKLVRYFTGRPCNQGHIAERYTSNGACIECMGRNVAMDGDERKVRSEAAHAEYERRQQVKEAKAAALLNLVEGRFRVFVEDWPVLRDTAVGMCCARFPVLERMDVISTKPPIMHAAGTALFRTLIDPQDVEVLRATADALLAARRKVDISAIRARILQTVLAIADEHGSCPDSIDIKKPA